MFIESGTGTQLVGDDLNEFRPGDVTLIGPNLPHAFRCTHGTGKNRAVLVFFDQVHMTDLLATPEMKPIQKLLDRSSQGLKVVPGSANAIGDRINEIHKAAGSTQVVLLLSVLEALSHPRQVIPISGHAYSKPRSKADGARLNAILDHIFQNYERRITLSEIASVAHMAPTAFCRYFKRHTDRTFSEFLTEVRISHACRALTDDRLTISEAAFASGFNNLSHFNQQFKRLKGVTPSLFVDKVLS